MSTSLLSRDYPTLPPLSAACCVTLSCISEEVRHRCSDAQDGATDWDRACQHPSALHMACHTTVEPPFPIAAGTRRRQDRIPTTTSPALRGHMNAPERQRNRLGLDPLEMKLLMQIVIQEWDRLKQAIQSRPQVDRLDAAIYGLADDIQRARNGPDDPSDMLLAAFVLEPVKCEAFLMLAINVLYVNQVTSDFDDIFFAFAQALINVRFYRMGQEPDEFVTEACVAQSLAQLDAEDVQHLDWQGLEDLGLMFVAQLAHRAITTVAQLLRSRPASTHDDQHVHWLKQEITTHRRLYADAIIVLHIVHMPKPYPDDGHLDPERSSINKLIYGLFPMRPPQLH